MKVLSSLCIKDSRHPDYAARYDADDKPIPRVKCFCDNCFYGRDALAVPLLETLNLLKRIDARCHAGVTPSSDDYAEIRRILVEVQL